MNRRNSTNPQRLDRRKSTASAKSVQLEHIRPETAERHAQVAATQAFTRARERSATDAKSPLWPPPRSSTHGSCTTSCSPQSKTHQNENRPHREQSIRFVPSRPVRLEPNNSLARDSSPSRKSQASKCHVINIEVDTRPSSRASASGNVSATKGAAGDYFDVLFTSDEHYTQEDDIASMPSSYRRLHKSKSLSINRETATTPQIPKLSKPSATTNKLPSPIKQHPQQPQHPRADENIHPRLGLQTPKSMNFLPDFRGSFGSASKYEDISSSKSSTLTCDENKEKTKNTLRPKPSRFFRSKTSSHDRAFKKSMRDISNSTIPTDNETIKDGSLRLKARKVSQGFKMKLKNLFGLAKGDCDEATLPSQHIESQKSHILGLEELDHDSDNELRSIPSAEQGAVSYVASGIPSLHAVPSYQQLRSRQGSMDSLQSEQVTSDERSRVTSWSNSDTNTVITLNSCQEERENKRLSIINENGAHVCSSSVRVAPIYEQSNKSSLSLQQTPQPPPTAIDGRRIYSALMKRQVQSQQASPSGLETKHSEYDTMKSETLPGRKSSLRLWCGGSTTIPATIRYVMPESESDPESPNANDRTRRTDENGSPSVGIRKTPLQASESKNIDKGDVISKTMDNSFLSAPGEKRRHSIARSLSSRGSAFFGSASHNLFRSQSPYRRALQDKMHTASNEQSMRSPENNPWMRSVSSFSIRCASTCESDADIKMTYTESIYSTNTEDCQNRRQSALSIIGDLPQPPPVTHGEAAILDDPPGQEKRSSSLPRGNSVSSSSSSVEWKTFLSSNVSKLEDSTLDVEDNDFRYSLPFAYSGHVRENAQMNDDEEDPVSISRQDQRKGSNFTTSDRDIENRQPSTSGVGDVETYIPTGYLRVPSTNTSPAKIPTTSLVPEGESKKAIVKARPIVDRDKALPRTPWVISTGNNSHINRHATITTRLVRRHPPKPKPTNINDNSTVTPPKVENISPTAAVADSNNNQYPHHPDGQGEVEDSRILSPDQETFSSNKMVDVFLSSRRRRMASTDADEGSVFL